MTHFIPSKISTTNLLQYIVLKIYSQYIVSMYTHVEMLQRISSELAYVDTIFSPEIIGLPSRISNYVTENL